MYPITLINAQSSINLSTLNISTPNTSSTNTSSFNKDKDNKSNKDNRDNRESEEEAKARRIKEWIEYIKPYGAEGDEIRRREEARYKASRPSPLDTILESELTKHDSIYEWLSLTRTSEEA